MIKRSCDSWWGLEVLHLFYDIQMYGVEPNSIAFVGILCACTHSGLAIMGSNQNLNTVSWCMANFVGSKWATQLG